MSVFEDEYKERAYQWWRDNNYRDSPWGFEAVMGMAVTLGCNPLDLLIDFSKRKVHEEHDSMTTIYADIREFFEDEEDIKHVANLINRAVAAMERNK